MSPGDCRPVLVRWRSHCQGAGLDNESCWEVQRLDRLASRRPLRTNWLRWAMNEVVGMGWTDVEKYQTPPWSEICAASAHL
jgi:hypothetical protein